MHILLLVVSLIFVAQKSESACTEGYQTSRDNFWYTCTRGNLVPIACVSPDGDRIEEGSSYQSAKFLMQCARDPKNPTLLKMAPVACINNGMQVDVGATFSNDRTQLLQCSSDGNTLSVKLLGCIGDDGAVIPNGGVVTRSDTAYTCTATDGGAQLTAKSCLFSGVQYPPGATVESSGVWYKCERAQDGSMALKLKGCVSNNTKYEIGQRFKDFWFTYECQLLGGTALAAGVACVERYPNGTVAEYKPGEKWLVGVGVHNRYQILCKKEGLIIRRQGVACYYTTNEGEGFLQGGCMRIVGFEVLQCTAPTPKTPNVRIRVTEHPTAADWERLRLQGMKLC